MSNREREPSGRNYVYPWYVDDLSQNYKQELPFHFTFRCAGWWGEYRSGSLRHETYDFTWNTRTTYHPKSSGGQHEETQSPFWPFSWVSAASKACRPKAPDTPPFQLPVALLPNRCCSRTSQSVLLPSRTRQSSRQSHRQRFDLRSCRRVLLQDLA